MSTPSTNSKRKFDIPPFEAVSKTSIRLFDEINDSIVLGVVHAKTGLFSARHNGNLYVGQYDFNLGFYDGRGDCIDEHILGFSISSLLPLFADQTKKSGMSTVPREEWKAHFDFKAVKESGKIRIRLHFSSPFEAHERDHSFQAEMELHEIK